jgi:hypothetical protein
LAVGLLQGKATANIAITFPPLRKTEQGALPFARGPSHGVILYGFTDDTKSELHTLNIASGEDRMLFVTPEIVHDAVWDADNGRAIFVELSRATRKPAGIFAVDGGAGQPRQLFEGWAQEDTTGAVVDTPLLSAIDGRLAVASCTTACEIRATQPGAAGPFRLLASGLPSRIVFGVSGVDLFMESACRAPCRATAVNLATGQVHDGPEYCEVVVPLDDAVDPVVLSDIAPNDNCGDGTYNVRATSVLTLQTWQPFHSQQPQPRLVAQGGWELPPGEFLLAQDGLIGPTGPEGGFVINARDGRAQPFPANQSSSP